MAPPAVVQARQELNKQAFLNVMKYLSAAAKEGKESFAFTIKLKKEDCLNIDPSTYKDVMAECAKIKQGGLAAAGSLQYATNLVGGSAGGGGGTAAALAPGPASTNYAAAVPQEAPKPGPKGKAAGLGGAMGGQTRPKAASKAGPKPKEPALPQYIGVRVQRYWDSPDGNGGQWYTAVATDYDAASHQYILTYSLGSSNEEFEKLNLDEALATSNPTVSFNPTDKVDLRALLGKSPAVAGSTVLQDYFAAKSTSAKSSKKRKSDGEDGQLF